jgi:hypothetical protein
MPVQLFVVDKADLQTALSELRNAEERGFAWCRPVFRLYPDTSNSENLVDRVLRYSDLWERADPIDGRFDWGRYQKITENWYFHSGKLQTAPLPKPTTRKLLLTEHHAYT